MNRACVVFAIALLFSGCGHAPPAGEAWGQGATIVPGWTAVRQAAVAAVTDPYTWAPVVGAAALQLGDADTEIAGDLRRNKPLFGSTDTADDTSDALRWASVGTFIALGLGAPGPANASQWRRTKGQGLLVGGAALGTTIGLTDGLKSTIDRRRPNGTDQRSLPSGHASATAAAARLSADALRYHDLNRDRRTTAHAGLLTLTTATAWARVEAGEHHPSDVLLGAALGNFVAVFTSRALLQPGAAHEVAVNVTPLSGGALITLVSR